MIPIIYDKDEALFTSNGLGRLRDCISCVVTEERNGIYECDFEYPITGANFDLIQCGRIVGVTHDDSGDLQPFDIVSYSRPLDGIVSFHCTHISYRQSYMTVKGTNINSLSDAFTLFGNATPLNPFAYQTDMTKSGYLACADGIPRSVRQMLGGIEGSILDTYGGEYEWDKWTVKLYSTRGTQRPFVIRYGVNMMSYIDELDTAESYSSCIPYWTDGEQTVVATKVDSSSVTLANHGETVPLDLSEKFETKPTTTALRNEAVSYMNSSRPYLPTQTIRVSFARLQDMAGYEDFANLEQCGLCDTIKVVFPDYGTGEYFKIVKTVWNVLEDKYDEMELGSLSTTLSEALGISVSPEKSSGGGNVFDDLTVNNDLTVGNNINATGDLSVNDIIATGTITAEGHTSAIGTMLTGTNNSNLQLTSGTGKYVSKVTLDKGSWILLGNARFPAASVTDKLARLNITDTSGATNIDQQVRYDNVIFQMQCVRFYTVNADNTDYYFNAYQNTGSAKTLSLVQFYAIRIA